MELMNCRKCGKMFQRVGGPPLCSECRKELEDKFTEVKKYVKENPQSNINKISADNDVPVPQINQWIREESLSFTEDSVVTLSCEKCGAPIRTGRFCQNCKSTMITKMEGSTPNAEKKAVKKKEEARMRFLDNRRD